MMSADMMSAGVMSANVLNNGVRPLRTAADCSRSMAPVLPHRKPAVPVSVPCRPARLP